MALIIEDGTIVSGAETYVDVTFVDTYFADRGSPEVWTALDTANKESSIRYATLYFESRYSFKGCLQTTTQPLSFPRSSFIGNDGRTYAGTGVIPVAIKQAIAELALRHATEDLFYISDEEDSRTTSESVDGHSLSFESKSSQYRGGKTFPIVVTLLQPYLIRSSLQVSIQGG